MRTCKPWAITSLASLLVAAAVTACDGGTPQSTSPGATSPAAAAVRNVRIVPRTAIRRDRRSISDVALFGPYAAWAEGPARSDSLTEVVVFDTRSGASRVVATAPPGGEVDAVRSGSAQTSTLIAYTVLERFPTDANPYSTWRLEAVDVVSGVKTVIARSTQPDPAPTIPVASLFGRWCAWAQYDAPTKSNTIVVEDLTTHAVHDVAKNVQSSAVGGDGDVLVYDDSVGSAVGQRAVLGVNLRTGQRKRISAVGNVGEPAVANGAVTWQQRTAPPPSNAQAEWYVRLDSQSTPVVIANSQNGNAIAGRDVVAWLDDRGGLQVASIPQRAAAVVAQAVPIDPGMVLSIAARWHLDGDRLIWASNDASGNTTVVHIDDVVLG